MERITATRAAREFSDLLNRVCHQGVSFEVERGNKVVARLIPVGPAARVPVADLNRVLAELPRLAEDVESFAADLEAVRRAPPPEGDPRD
jgi:antitoxin (DNA-binding transcriptional repressor) of toxin-antitoxin stability system